MRTSYSALSTYQQCPLKYKFQEIDHIRVSKGVEAIFGNIIHACLKFMFERDPLYPTIDEIIDYFRKSWESKNGLEMNKGENNAYCEEGISILKNFYKKNQPWNFNILDLESKFEVILNDLTTGENHVLAGKIDRIDKISEDNYEIIDYKTSRRMPSQENLDKDLQMAIYHMGLIKRWPHIKSEKIKLSLFFLKHGEKITTSRSNEDLEKTKNSVLCKIREIQDRLLKKDFPAYPSRLCDWCGYKPQCPMWKHQFFPYGESPEGRQIDIKNIINEYLELKGRNQQNNRRINALQAQICEFMDQKAIDRVFGQTGYLTRVLQERTAYDMTKIKAILDELGRWNEVVKKKRFSVLKASKKKTGE